MARFPSGTLKAQRALIAIQMYYPEKLVPTTRKFWNFYWQEKKDIEGEGATQQSAESTADRAP